MTHPEVLLLGPPRVHRWRLPYDQRLWLLAYLTAQGGHATRDEVLGVFWPDKSERDARNNLRVLLHRLRQAPWGQAISAQGGALHLPLQSDVQQLRRAYRAGDWPGVLRAYQGPFVQGLQPSGAPDFEAWLHAQRTQLEDAWKSAARRHLGTLEAAGRPEEALTLLENMLALAPDDEDALQDLLRLGVRWPGAAQVAVQAYQRFAGALAREVGGQPLDRTDDLFRQLGGARRAGPAAPPATGTPGLERTVDLQAVTDALRRPECRLLTVVGLGGSGKTWLAERASAALRADFADGTVQLDLGLLEEPEQLPGHLARALGLRVTPDEPLWPQVRRFLSTRQMLVVLDSLEPLLGERRPAMLAHVTALLEAPGLKLLLTSQEALGHAAEWISPLHGLPWPTDASLPLDALLRVPALALFVARAQQANPQWRPAPEDRALLVTVGQLTEGLPLALELLAASLRFVPLAEVVKLAREGADVPLLPGRAAHHVSLQAVLQHIWRHVPAEEREVLCRLSVLTGSFCSDAAQAVAGATFATLVGLQGRALVRRDAQGRFHLHPLVCQFAATQRTGPEEAEALQARHAAFYGALARAVRPGLVAGAQREGLATLDAEADNLGAAWAWGVRRARGEVLLELLRTLVTVRKLREILPPVWTDTLASARTALLGCWRDPTPVQAQVLAYLELLQVQDELAHGLTRDGAARLSALMTAFMTWGDGVGLLHSGLALAWQRQRTAPEPGPLRAALDEAVTLLGPEDAREQAAWAVRLPVEWAYLWARRQGEGGSDLLDTVTPQARAAGVLDLYAGCLMQQEYQARRRRNPSRDGLLQEAARVYRAIDHHHGAVNSLMLRLGYALDDLQVPAAEEDLAEMRRLLNEHSDPRLLGMLLRCQAQVAEARGEPHSAEAACRSFVALMRDRVPEGSGSPELTIHLLYCATRVREERGVQAYLARSVDRSVDRMSPRLQMLGLLRCAQANAAAARPEEAQRLAGALLSQTRLPELWRWRLERLVPAASPWPEPPASLEEIWQQLRQEGRTFRPAQEREAQTTDGRVCP
ncbi:ATP-binding protein [Deinococcus aquaedulcis]|uniref:ATP-binding protein n=1 Tax=Deinococcus aquaedulcis TaxID=2840455 RepID=UPI001C828852|nr:BTAD domain-containing putative transcriptional regulator [Deinococcus aquaedulcis]